MLGLIKLMTAAGKPVMIQEMYPLSCGMPAFKTFLERSRELAAGWESFYWGETSAEYRKTRKIEDALIAAWLDFFQEQGPRFRAP